MKSSKLNRRELIAGGAAAAGAALISSCSSLSEKSCSAEKGRGLKIGICDWTLGLVADTSAFAAAKELGADGVQVDFGMFDDNLPVLYNKELQASYPAATRKSKLEIASFALSALSWATYKNDERGQQWISDGIDLCEAMGVGVILLPFFGGADLANDAAGRRRVADKLKLIAPKAEKAGVVLGLESWLSAAEHMEIIERAGSPAVKVYYDVANSLKAGHDIYRDIELLGKHICEFHAKDYAGPFGKGSIDFLKVRRLMEKIDYRGWIVFESSLWQPKTPPEAPELTAGFLYNMDYLRRVFG